MTNRITPLHRALGVLDGTLADLLPAALAQTVAEDEDLDWKRELPHPSNPNGMLELATDFAAMANTSGGLIVYGVGEAAEGNAADQFVSVVGDSAEVDQRLHQAAYRAQPPITGMMVEPVTLVGGEQLYAVHIDASTAVPHLVTDRARREWFRAPVRHGAHTQYMSERQLEQAYAQRFRVLGQRQDALMALSDEVAADQDLTAYPVFLAVAIPHRLRPTWASRPTKEDARRLLGSTSRLPRSFPSNLPYGRLPNGSQVRTGLRRWVDRYASGVAQIHHDGTVACTYRLGPWRSGQNTAAASNEVSSQDVEALACEIVVLVQSVGNEYGLDVYDLRVTIGWEGQPPLAIRGRHEMSSFYNDADPNLAIRRFLPVSTSVTIRPDPAAWPPAASELAEDLLAQAGLVPKAI